MSKKYKVVKLEFDALALVAVDEVLFFDNYLPENRKNPNKKLSGGEYIDTKSWKLDRYSSFLSRNEFSRILEAYRCLGY